MGDFNGHSVAWDNRMDEDQRGKDILEWADNNGMHICNDGTPTRTSPENGNESAPDVTIANKNISGKVNWKVLDSIGSDHHPIKISINHKAFKPHDKRREKLRIKKANWMKFNTSLETDLQHWNIEPPTEVKTAEEEFRKAVHKATKSAIPKGSLCRPGNNWWNNDIDKQIKRRNQLEHKAKRSQEDCERWKTSCKEVKKAVKQAKRESWRNFVEAIDPKTEPKKVAYTIKALEGNAIQTNKNEVIKVGERIYANDKEKADLFIRHYAQVSKLKLDKEDRKIRKGVNVGLKHSCEHHNDKQNPCKEFTIHELNAAIKKLPNGKASGEDDILNEMLIAANENIRKHILHIANLSWKKAECAKTWKTATIIPIPKPGKPLDKCESYRPISLTSCLGKLIERMVKNRLTYYLERNNILSSSQAGFRKARSTEEQIARCAQHIVNGLQERKRSVMCLIDFSKAYDRVWRSGLYKKMLDMGIPQCIIKWIKSYLTDRTAKVRLGEKCSKIAPMKEGLPQGSVIAPILWLIYINDISDNWKEVEESLFADDTAMIAQSKDFRVAAQHIQKNLDDLKIWCEKWKVLVNASKCEVLLITKDPRESNFKAKINIQYGQEQIKQVKEARFLGVVFEQSMNFTEHCKTAYKKVMARVNILNALAGKDWGQRGEDLRNTFNQYVRPIGEYALGAWGPHTTKTNIEKIQRAQNRAARIISGCLSSTPIPKLLEEAGIENLSTTTKIKAGQLYQKICRLPENNPAKNTISQNVRQRIKNKDGTPKSCLKSIGVKIEEDCGLANLHKERVSTYDSYNPEEWGWKHTTKATLKDGINRSVNNEVNKNRGIDTIEELDETSDITFYTDGSVTNGKKGGAGVVLTRDNITIRREGYSAGAFCNSCRAELVAIDKALSMAAEDPEDRWRVANIFTDSKAAIESIERGPQGQKTELNDTIIQKMKQLDQRGKVIKIQWIPAHCDIPGNEDADTLAKEGGNRDQLDVGIPYDVAKNVIKQKYAEKPQNKNKGKYTSRKEEVTSHQIRTGHCYKLGTYKNRLDNNIPDTCEDCGEVDTAEHFLLHCPRWYEARYAIYGTYTINSEETRDNTKLSRFLLRTRQGRR